MMVARLALGSVTDPLTDETTHPAMGLDTIDATITLHMVVYGFFMLAIVQLLGIFGGDRAPLQVSFPYFMTIITSKNVFFQDALLAICGFLLYLSVGAKTAAVTHDTASQYDTISESWDQKAAYGGLASMCILTSLVYLVDFVFSLINLKNA